MRLLPTISLLLALCATPALADGGRMVIRSSPLAGSQYYDLDLSREQIKLGDELTLIRESDNRHDRNAIRVEWRGRKLGYLPRAHNQAVARAIDEGESVVARISQIRDDANPWRRLEFEVLLKL